MRATPYTNEELEQILATNVDQFGNTGDSLIHALVYELRFQRTWLADIAAVLEAQIMSLRPRVTGQQRRKLLAAQIRRMKELALGANVEAPPERGGRGERAQQLARLRQDARERGVDAACDVHDMFPDG